MVFGEDLPTRLNALVHEVTWLAAQNGIIDHSRVGEGKSKRQSDLVESIQFKIYEQSRFKIIHFI